MRESGERSDNMVVMGVEVEKREGIAGVSERSASFP